MPNKSKNAVLTTVSSWLVLWSLVWIFPAIRQVFALQHNAGPAKAAIEELRVQIPESMKQANLPGFAIALVDKKGIVWSEAFGHTARDGKRPINAQTIFSLQSVSKNLTALAALAAVRDGLVSLDAPIVQYLPDFTVNSRFETRPETKMTLRLLLSHKAGFTHEAPMGNNYDPSYPSFEAYIHSISKTWLRYPVGQRHSYSNLGVDLAGYILQAASGKPFPQYVKEAVLDPLGMTASSFDWRAIKRAENRAIGHAAGFDETPLEFGLIPSGGLYSNVEDMAKLLRFYLNGGVLDGKPWLPQALLAEMTAIPRPADGQTQGYGLGTGLYRRNGHDYFNHNGGGFGFLSHFSWHPDLGVGVVALSNADSHNLAYRLPFRLTDAFAAARPAGTDDAGAHSDLKERPVERPDKLAGSYVGSGAEIEISETEKGYDFALGGRNLGRLHFTSAREAFIQLGPRKALFRFFLNPDGSPQYILSAFDGRTADYNDGPNDKPGPNKPSWTRFEGQYRYTIWGAMSDTVEIRRKNGYLYYENLKLEERQPGLFFSGNGEALDFRGRVPTWRNIKLEKQ